MNNECSAEGVELLFDTGSMSTLLDATKDFAACPVDFSRAGWHEPMEGVGGAVTDTWAIKLKGIYIPVSAIELY